MFESLTIVNLRAITHLEMKNLGQLNVLVGDNNCGKTTILEGIFFLIGATNPALPLNANTFRGLKVFNQDLWPTFFHEGQFEQPIEISARRAKSGDSETLKIRPRKKSSTSLQEVDPDVLTGPPHTGDSKTRTVLEGLELEYSESSDPHSKVLSAVYQKGDQMVTEGAKERSLRGIFVSPLTEFDWKPRFAAVQRKKRVQQLISFLNEIEPNIADLRLNDVGLLEADIGLPTLIPVNLIGGGLARFMSIALAMLDCENGIVLVDEIDNGLHHSAQEKVWRAVFTWADRFDIQVFATTHSYESLNAFTACASSSLFPNVSKLYRIEREDKTFKAVEFAAEDLTISLSKKWEIR
ncbi:MAG: AAA family ATPase [Planctomycetota bacterium]|jgi:AAA15 family ATPase/GTPase